MFDGLFDDLIDIASLRNLFIPLSAFFMDLVYGPGIFFGVPSMAGYSKREICQLLEQNGIIPWGDMYDGEMIIFSVKEEQKWEAYQILDNSGIAVLFPVLTQ